MPNVQDLRRRLRSVKNMQQITRAMKMIAAARMRRAQDRVLSARPYEKQMRLSLKALLRGLRIAAIRFLPKDRFNESFWWSLQPIAACAGRLIRSEERRVGKECR